MNSKNALPWILVFILAVSAGFFFISAKNKEKELAQLRQENAELPQLRAALEQTKAHTDGTESGLTEKEHGELIRLRNEVGILRREKQQLTTQLSQAQQSAERIFQTQQAELRQRNQPAAPPLQFDKARDICINNLRQIDGAKQQWALENKQPSDAFVIMQQITPYLAGPKPLVCPAGGSYTLNNVSTAPTCSIPGHALPP